MVCGLILNTKQQLKIYVGGETIADAAITYVLLRNSLVFAHCCLTSNSNSAGVTGSPDASSWSPSTKRTSEKLKEKSKRKDCETIGRTCV